MYLSIFITICLVVGAITFHYWVLGLLLGVVPNPETDHSHFLRSLSLLLMIVFSHVLEIVVFALGYLAGVRYLGWSMPGFGGDQILSFFDAFYHSATTYSTLGLSKVPSGEAGFMTAMESLTGIIILTWSATFFYNILGRTPSKDDE